MKRALLAIAVALLPSLAHADDTTAVCADAANAGQPLRRTGHFRAAREQFLRCARDECPDSMRTRCTGWLTEVDAALPSVVFRAPDVTGLRIAIDDEPMASAEGIATIIDPGPHRVRYEAPSEPAREESLVVAQGEKNRVVLLVFPARPPSELPPPPVLVTRAPLVSPAVAYGLGALGVVALGAFAALEIKAHGDYDDLQNGCARAESCDPSDLRSVRTTGSVAVVFGAVGVATLATSVFFLLWRPKAPSLSSGNF